jgi:signal transduction histidine kinase
MTQSLSRILRVFLPWRGLIWQLLVITILPLAFFTVVIAFGSLTVHRRAMRSLVGERDKLAIKTAAVAVEEQMRHREDAIFSLAVMVENIEFEKIQNIFNSLDYLYDEFDQGLAIYDQNGALRFNTGDQQVWEGLTDRIDQSISRQNEPNKPQVLIVSDLNNLTNDDKLVLVLARSANQNWIIVGASLASDLFQHTLATSLTSGAGVSTVIVDSNGEILYQSDSFLYPGGSTAHSGIDAALRGESGILYVPVSESEHVVTYSPIGHLGWAITFEEPWDAVNTPILRTTEFAPLVLVPVLLLTLLALWFGLRWIVRPLLALEGQAEKLAWGDFDAIEKSVGGIAEIRHLQSELIHMARKVNAAQRSLHSYIGAITAGQEEERKRLARELHDDTIQSLIALKQRVQLVQYASEKATPDESMAEVISLTEKTIENVRRQTRALRPIYLEDLGLMTALEMLARETSQAANIPVNFQHQGRENRLDPDVELALYRMVQEALNNIARHAQASQANLNIKFQPDQISVQVIDDGIGFDVPLSPAEFAPSGHFGLLGLYERAELIGARLEIHSSPGEGCQIDIHLPVNF